VPADDPAVGRCPWVDLTKPDYVAYHDREWGVPVHDDRRIFEFLTLEAAQAGLSWYTILRKREGYRAAFANFAPAAVARFGDAEVAALMENSAIVRNRKKIEAAIGNARRFLEIQDAFGSFDAYIWRFVDGRPRVNEIRTAEEIPTQSPESEALSRDLRKRGFRFMGPVIVYAHMQATGMVNDHLTTCFRRAEILADYSG